MGEKERKKEGEKKKETRERENNASFRFVRIGWYFQISSISRGENERVHKSE